MVDGPDGRGDGTELQAVARALADTVPLLVERLSRARPGRIYREALELLERPLLGHVLAMTGGNQLRAARVLGLNRNTLRKRCRELRLALPREPRRAPTAPLADDPEVRVRRVAGAVIWHQTMSADPSCSIQGMRASAGRSSPYPPPP